jgi:hypothetical protein
LATSITAPTAVSAGRHRQCAGVAIARDGGRRTERTHREPAGRSQCVTGLVSVRIALAFAPMLAAMAIGVCAAAAASPSMGAYTTRAVGQLSPYVLIQVNDRHRIMLISLSNVRCMSRSGRLDMMIGIRQRGGSFSITRRSGMFHVKTGEMLEGRDERVRGQFTSPGTATGSVRVIKIPRVGARPCNSGWLRFRVAAMDPVEGVPFFPGPTTLTPPATATEQIKIVNRSIAPSKTNRVTLTLQAYTGGGMSLASAPTTTVSTAQGRCSTPRWQTTSEGLEATIACDLGRLEAGQRTAITVSSSFPSAPSPCDGRVDLSIDARIERAALNESSSMPIESQGPVSGFEFLCP